LPTSGEEHQDLPLTLVRIALFSAKKRHGFEIFYILRAIDDGNHFPLGTEGLTDTHSLSNVIEVALRRIPITPDLNPNFVVRHSDLLPGVGVFVAIFTPSSPMRLGGFGPFDKPTTPPRRLRRRPLEA